MPKANVAKHHAPAQAADAKIARWNPLQDQLLSAVAGGLADPATLSTDPDELRNSIDTAVVAGLELALQGHAERWAEQVLGAERYAHSKGRKGYLSGHREHRFHFSVGPVSIRVPKPRRGSSRPDWVPALKAMPQKLQGLVRELWVRGLSYRDISSVSNNVLDHELSHSSLGTVIRDVTKDTLQWLNRPIDPKIRYLVLDALYVPVKRQTSRKEALLVAMGITEEGYKQVLDVLHAPSESADAWGTVLARLKMRGLDPDQLDLVSSDGDAGLLAALHKELKNVRRQRCTVHKVRNVLGSSPRHLKGTIPAQASDIYKAPNRAEAKRRASVFIEEYQQSLPKVAGIVADDLDACLAFYDLDANLWKSLRSTNVIERMNREFRRKLREVGAMKGEVNVLRIAVTVAQFINEEAKDKPIVGFKQRAGRKKCAPRS